MSNKVLVIDDESVTRRVVLHALKTLDVETIMAEDGASALEQAAQHNFILAIVDINLPDMTGFDLIQALRNLPHMQQVPMVMFTARNQSQDTLLAEELGATGFLYKPFSTQELRTLVERYLIDR